MIAGSNTNMEEESSGPTLDSVAKRAEQIEINKIISNFRGATATVTKIELPGLGRNNASNQQRAKIQHRALAAS